MLSITLGIRRIQGMTIEHQQYSEKTGSIPDPLIHHSYFCDEDRTIRGAACVHMLGYGAKTTNR